MMEQVDAERLATSGKGRLALLKELLQPGIRNRLAIGVWIFIFMQMAGSNAINYYSPLIFGSLGFGDQTVALYATGIYGIIRLVAVFFAMYFVVDRFGRTRMLMAGSAVMALCMYYVGAYTKVTDPANTPHVSSGGYAALVLIYIYAVGFCFSWAGIPWIYASEIFPLRVRSVGMSLCAATHWLFNFMM